MRTLYASLPMQAATVGFELSAMSAFSYWFFAFFASSMLKKSSNLSKFIDERLASPRFSRVSTVYVVEKQRSSSDSLHPAIRTDGKRHSKRSINTGRYRDLKEGICLSLIQLVYSLDLLIVSVLKCGILPFSVGIDDRHRAGRNVGASRMIRV